jgi:hypothetical protein
VIFSIIPKDFYGICRKLGGFVGLKALTISAPFDEIICRVLSDTVLQRKIAAVTDVKRQPSLLARQFIEMVKEEYPI